MIKCSARIVARVFPPLPAPPVRPLLGSGASVGPIRRIVVPMVVSCVTLGALAVPPILYFNRTPLVVQPGQEVVVSEPTSLALYALGLALLMFIHAIRRTRNA
jgi:hypothetical protein